MKKLEDNRLVDGIQMNADNPETFDIPTNEDIDNLTIGSHVKVGFKSDNGTERMWVKLTNEVDGNTVNGVLDNDPVLVEDIECGDLIQFERKHIIGIYE